MPVHHLLEQILNEYIEAAGLQSGQPLFPKRKFTWNGGNRTGFEPVQRLGSNTKAGKGGGFSHACWMSYLAGHRDHNLLGERRKARARPADGRT